jgi:hypothetical protein
MVFPGVQKSTWTRERSDIDTDATGKTSHPA